MIVCELKMALSWLILLILLIIPPIKGNSDSLKGCLQVALDHAMAVRANIYSLGNICRDEMEKAAWVDCLELHDSIVTILNQTLDYTRKPSASDVQTWLSTALTNLETCKEGFVDLKKADNSNVMPLIFKNNLGVLIGNCLAENKENYDSEKRSFPPICLSSEDRKLLRYYSGVVPDIVVAQNGSGKYKTVGEALAMAASKRRGNKRFVIYVMAGIYVENVNITCSRIMLVGDGIGKTIITGNNSVGGGFTTFKTPTVAVTGEGFTARGITFRNTAGPQNHQAVALLSSSDCSAFYQCSFEGYQDTLCVLANRQFYRECDIYGTVDFIFGNAAAVFQNCNIFARNSPSKINTLTAQGRTNPNQTTGIIIQNCKVTAASDFAPYQDTVKTFLGRPWRNYSRTVFMKTFLDNLIDPAGWMPWRKGELVPNTLFYGEYLNTGNGSSTANRVKWPGFHVITSLDEASDFTVEKFVDGDYWLPGTKIPFKAGL